MNRKLSVIIPTLQVNITALRFLLEKLIADDIVSEIIIINNSTKEFPISNSKIKVHNHPENLYVNPSWNYGVAIAANDAFLIINDDILCCDNFCSKVISTGVLDLDYVGLVGLNSDDILNFYKPPKASVCKIPDNYHDINNDCNIDFMPMPQYLNLGFWGCAIFGLKKNYYNIPNSLKIIYGDNYLAYMNIKFNKKLYKILGLKFSHLASQSSTLPVFYDILYNDKINFDKFIEYEKRY